MVLGLQVAGLFLAITAALAFTAWAETWLVSPTASARRHVSSPKRSFANEAVDDLSTDDNVNQAA